MNSVEIVKTLVTALQSGDMELAANAIADDFTVSGLTPRQLNKREFLAMQSELLTAMPDFSYNLDDVREEHGHVRALLSITGTHMHQLSLPMLGIQSLPATGLAIRLPQVPAIYELSNEQVVRMQVEHVPGSGLSGLMQQIGAELPVAPREQA